MLAFIRDHVMHVVTHEVDEWLRYDDELIHDPHMWTAALRPTAGRRKQRNPSDRMP